VQCVVWIVHNFTKQLIVTLLQQLAKNSAGHRLLRRRNSSTRWRRSVALITPLHAGDAYVSLETTTAQNTACRPAAVSP